MAYSSPLAHHSNDNHARGIHDQDKEINHLVNYEKAKFRTVTLVHPLKKCCNNDSCEDCKKPKRKAMKLQQVKAITISKLFYRQTGTKTLRWPPLNNFGSNSGSPPDAAYRQGTRHFLITGKEIIIEGKKMFSPEHVDGPVIEKRNETFEDRDGNVYDFIHGESTSSSEMEIMEYYGTASDNNLPLEPPKRSARMALKETKKEKEKLEKENAKMEEEKSKMKVEKAKTVQFLSHKLKVDKDGNNLLHRAALEGKNQNVKVFLENELFDLEAKNGLGETALHCAIKKEKRKAIQILSNFGADLSQTFQDKDGKMCSSISKDKDGNNLLHHAVLKNNISDVTMYLEKDVFDLEAKNKRKETVLHCAAMSGNIEVVILLLEHEVREEYQRTSHEQVVTSLDRKHNLLEAKDQEGKTPLLTAIKYHHEQVVEQLIISGANLRARNKYKKTPLHLASYWGNLNIVQLLIEKKPNLLKAKDRNKETPLFSAIACKHEQVVEQLIISRADLEARDNVQQTPLHYATRWGNTKIVQLLIEKNPSILEAKDKYGRTPLFSAILSGNEQVVEEVIKSGADLEARDKYGQQTPLHYASSEQGNIKIVQLLLEKNPILLETKNEFGNTPLYESVNSVHWPDVGIDWYNYESVKLLHGAGANLNTTNKNGKTPLHAAVSKSHPADPREELENNKRMVEFLLKNKANIAARDKHGNIPLHDAGHYFNSEENTSHYINCHIVKLLIDAGSDLEAKNHRGKTPPNLKFCDCKEEDCLVNPY